MSRLKDFFYFNRGQRIGIIFLLVLIILAVAGTIFMPLLIRQPPMDDGSAFLKEAEEFKNNLTKIEKAKGEKRKPNNTGHYRPRDYSASRELHREKYELFAFNPNTADSVTLIRLGIIPGAVRNILRYRRAKGVFRRPEDLKKIRALSEEKFEELKPYIQLAETTSKSSSEAAEEAYAVPEEASVLTVELNTADTAQLKKIRGIGRFYASQIVRYRNRLGGYVAVEQLKEVQGMTAENYDRISASFVVDTSAIRKINVNKASVEKLKFHPYIKTFWRAKAIYEYRQKKVKLQNISQLYHLDEFTEDDWRRLAPYLEFK